MAEKNNNNEQQQDLGQLLKVRREKLSALQEAGADPFQITKYDQTHHNDASHQYATSDDAALDEFLFPSEVFLFFCYLSIHFLLFFWFLGVSDYLDFLVFLE